MLQIMLFVVTAVIWTARLASGSAEGPPDDTKAARDANNEVQAIAQFTMPALPGQASDLELEEGQRSARSR